MTRRPCRRTATRSIGIMENVRDTTAVSSHLPNRTTPAVSTRHPMASAHSESEEEAVVFDELDYDRLTDECLSRTKFRKRGSSKSETHCPRAQTHFLD